MIERSLRDEVTIYNRTTSGTSVYGDPIEVDGTPTTVRAWVNPLDATEDEINRDVRTTRYRVILDPDTSVSGTSRIVWKSKSYEVVGEPQLFSARNGVHHQELMIRLIEG